MPEYLYSQLFSKEYSQRKIKCRGPGSTDGYVASVSDAVVDTIVGSVVMLSDGWSVAVIIEAASVSAVGAGDAESQADNNKTKHKSKASMRFDICTTPFSIEC